MPLYPRRLACRPLRIVARIGRARYRRARQCRDGPLFLLFRPGARCGVSCVRLRFKADIRSVTGGGSSCAKNQPVKSVFLDLFISTFYAEGKRPLATLSRIRGRLPPESALAIGTSPNRRIFTKKLGSGLDLGGPNITHTHAVLIIGFVGGPGIALVGSRARSPHASPGSTLI